MTSPELSADSQRRQATVLFADISGFTAMSEKLDPEEVTGIMNSCFAMLERIVVTHGGHVDKYIGDCIMALFGVPTAIEGAPRQALKAALEIRAAVDQFDKDRHLPVPLRAHTGVNTGLVIAGAVGGEAKHDFTVMGDAVNLASRLKDAAANGEIYVGSNTYAQTRAEFEYHPLKPLSLKGKKEPVTAYQLLSAKLTPERPWGRSIGSPMIGRNQELSAVRDRLRRLLDGKGGIVSIIGDAGLGKSRLLAELAKLDEAKRTLWLEGRAPSLGQSLSFHPFIDLLRQWAGIAGGDAEQVALSKLEAAITAVAGADTGELVPFIATLMGLRLSGAQAARTAGIVGEALERLILKSTRDLLRGLAAVQPLVLVFEDLHWADLSSGKLLEALLPLVGDARVLFIHALRPHYSEMADRIVQCASEQYAAQHVDLHLQPLDAAQCDQLVRNLLEIDDLPHSTRTLIASKAEGNPFYIEEVVRSLIDQGAVVPVDGRLRVTDKIASVVVPGTIQEVIMARVDRLEKPVRHVLEVAAVIGRSCNQQILADVLAGDATLEAKLAQLKERHLLLERRSRRTAAVRRRTLAEETEYIFHHVLVQETIYDSILQRTRKELHLKVARSIEALFAERLADFYGMLAYHYSRAEELQKAEEFLFKAGDEAVRSAASAEALTYFREAARIYFLIYGDGGDTRKKAVLERNIGLALLNTGNLIDCVTHFDRALEYLGERVPQSTLAATRAFVVNLAVVLFHLYVGRRQWATAADAARTRDVLDIMYAKARAQTTTDPQRFFFDSIASIRRLDRLDPRTVEGAGGKYAGAAALFSFSGFSFAISRRFLAVAQRLIRRNNVSDVFLYRLFLFVHNYFAGNWREPCEIDDALIEEALRRGQLWDVDSFLGLDCGQQLDRGDFAAASARLRKISEIITTYGYEFARSNEYAMQAFIPLARRDLLQALQAVERYHQERHEELLNLLALGTKAKIQILLGQYTAAEYTLQRAEALSARLGAVPPFHACAYLLSRFLLDVCALEHALGAGDRTHVRSLRRRARKSGARARAVAAKMAPVRTEAYRLTGCYYWLVGRPRRAARWWQRSIAEGERLGARPELARTYLEVGRRMLASPSTLANLNGLEAGTCIGKARAIFTELDLQWDLERLSRITPGGRSELTSVAA